MNTLHDSLLYEAFKPCFGFTALQVHSPNFKQSQMVRWSEYGIFPRKNTPPDPQQKTILSRIWPDQSPNPQWWADWVLLTCCLHGRQNCNIYKISDRSLLKIVCASYNLFYCMNWRVVYIKRVVCNKFLQLERLCERTFNHVIWPFIVTYLSRDMTKPTKWLCAQRRLRPAWASTQSDQSLRCPHEESLGPYLPVERTAKTLIRLGGCPGWSESSLDAQSFCWFCHVAAHLKTRRQITKYDKVYQKAFWFAPSMEDLKGLVTSALLTLNFITSYFLRLTSNFLLPTSFFWLLASYLQLPTSNFLLPTSYF